MKKLIKNLSFFLVVALLVQQSSASEYCEHVFFDELHRLAPPLPNFMRKELSTSYQRDILNKWKADSSTAKAWARTRGAKELEDLGFKNIPEYLPEEGLEITPGMLPSASYLGFTQTALTHPRMKKILKQMNEEGYKLLVDPTLAIRSEDYITMGTYRNWTKTIRILPKSTWDVFIHEYQHLQFDKMGFRGENFFASLDKIPAEAYAVAKKVKALQAKGLNNTAIDETLAVSKEIKSLYFMGYTPWSFPVYRAREYAWYHQLKGVNYGPQRKSFERVIAAKKFLLHPVFIRTVLGISGFVFLLVHQDEDKVIVIDEQGATAFKLVESPLAPADK